MFLLFLKVNMDDFDDFLEYECTVVLKPEYVSMVKHFIADRVWDFESYPFLYDWKKYMKSIDRYWICDNEEYIDTNPPLCMDGFKGKTKIFREVSELSENNTWTFAGATYNWNKELEYFIRFVLSVIADDALIDVAMNSRPTEIVTYDLKACLEDNELSFWYDLRTYV